MGMAERPAVADGGRLPPAYTDPDAQDSRIGL